MGTEEAMQVPNLLDIVSDAGGVLIGFISSVFEGTRILFLGHLGPRTALLGFALILSIMFVFAADSIDDEARKYAVVAFYGFMVACLVIMQLDSLLEPWKDENGRLSFTWSAPSLTRGWSATLLTFILMIAVVALLVAVVLLDRWREHTVLTHIGLFVAMFFAEMTLTAWEPTVASTIVLALVAIGWFAVNYEQGGPNGG